jgi:DNA-binding LacI/PurR family transcriptional regulator
MVAYDRMPGNLAVSKVLANDFEKSYFMVEPLIRSGRKRIAHFRAPDYISNAEERYRGYQYTLSKFKLPCDPALVITTGLTIDDGQQAAEKLLTSQTPFDSIFAFTDTLAIGAMNYLREQQVNISQEVAITSFSGTKLSTIVNPLLSTVEQPLNKMGKLAADLIFDRAAPDKMIVLQAELKLRESTEGHLGARSAQWTWCCAEHMAARRSG